MMSPSERESGKKAENEKDRKVVNAMKKMKRIVSMLLVLLMFGGHFGAFTAYADLEEETAAVAETATEETAAPVNEEPAVEAAPAEEISVEEVAAEVIAVEETPVEVVSAEETPVEEFQAEEEALDDVIAEEEVQEVLEQEAVLVTESEEMPQEEGHELITETILVTEEENELLSEEVEETEEEALEEESEEEEASEEETEEEAEEEAEEEEEEEEEILSATIEATDGFSYAVSVTYPNTAGIPMTGTALTVSEILPGTAAYDSYVKQSAETLSTTEQSIGYARVFDITIVDAADPSIVYEPTDIVDVQIRLFETAPVQTENMDVVHFEDNATASVCESSADGSTLDFATGSFSVYVVAAYTIEKIISAGDGSTFKITVSYGEDAQLPEDASLEAVELSGAEYADYLGRTEVLMDAASFGFARIFDISIVNAQGEHLEPAAPVDVKIQLVDADASEDFAVVHFSAEPEKMAAESEGNTVSFSTGSFSAYAIVQGLQPVEYSWHKVGSLAELLSVGEVFIGHADGYYFTNGITKISGSRYGITKTKPAESRPTSSAVLYRFEQVSGDSFRISTVKNGETFYMVQSGNSLNLTNNVNNATVFILSAFPGEADTFRAEGTNGYYINMQGGANGASFAAYNNATDVNARLCFWYHDEMENDPYGLDGKTYGLMNWTGGVYGKAMMAQSSGADALAGKELMVLTKAGDHNDKLFVPKDAEISMWTFHKVEKDRYTLSTVSEGNTRYLSITANGLSLTPELDDSCSLQLIPGTGLHANEVCLKAGNTALTYSGNIETGFSIGGTTGSEWLYLVSLSELTTDYYKTYSARKVSVSDSEVTNGSQILLYTRIWDDNNKKYVFYAVDHDGSLVPCYESGDSIQWVGSLLNTELWNLVEYYWEGTTDPNFFYELYNPYSEKYIAPQMTGEQILSNSTIGINMTGRRNGYYYSSILAWDDSTYAYTGLKVENGRVVPCTLAEADDFYFAILEDAPVDDELNTVPTVDHTQYGITMKIVNFATRDEMSSFLGNNEGGIGTKLHQGLLSAQLGQDNYPHTTLSTATGVSLASWFANAQEVNHLFIGSTYYGTGYYEYDSTQNFASLQKDGTFKVYKELGSYDTSDNRPTLQHGQFFPFNDLEAGVFTSINRQNLYSATASLLPDSDPRKYEQLYLIRNVDCYFGVEIEASFTQTPNGLDSWGHDIVYEFTGDDDFWLYVDGELIIDLGGIHSAVPGKVNYSTGDVWVNGKHTTLYEIFKSHYVAAHPDGDVNAYLNGIFEEKNGNRIFKDYSTHTMRIFYLERGAGASNLHMRFNLASIKPGTVELSKELDGVDAMESVLAEFPYQIFYRVQNGESPELTEYALTQTRSDALNVYYKNSITPVTFHESLTIDGIEYTNVFMLRPGEIAVIELKNAVDYRIVECGVNTEIFEKVSVNGRAISGSEIEGRTGRMDFSTGYAGTDARSKVAFTNKVDPAALRTVKITKKLYREDGMTPISYAEDASTFTFRLYFGTEFEQELTAANMHTYHVTDPSGVYCAWNAAQQRFIPLQSGETVYENLSIAEKASVSFTTSMNGSISKIPAFYTVEIRQVLAGTQYKVEERSYEIPDGYSLQKYTLNGASWEMVPPQGTILATEDIRIDVCNLRGYGFRVYKQWSDADYMIEREATCFALYTGTSEENLTLVDGSVRQLAQNQSTLYWYYLTLPVAGVAFDNYLIREVVVENPVTDENGTVLSWTSINPVAPNGDITLQGRQKGETAVSSFTYTALYEKGTSAEDSNVRIDTVTNNRPGIVLKKTMWNGTTPLAGARFTLKDSNGNLIGEFLSDENGAITVAFLSDGADYVLTETHAPQGYHGLEAPMTIRLNAGTVTVSGVDAEYYSLAQGNGTTPMLVIKNRPYTFQAFKKAAGSEENPLSGAHFALHKEKTVGGVTSIDPYPMAGYEDLVSDGSGLISLLDNTLPAGTYELRETAAPEGYQLLPTHIRFTVSETGAITLGAHAEGTTLTQTILSDGTIAYTLTVLNGMNNPAPTGITRNTEPFAGMLIAGIILCSAALLLTAFFRKRRGEEEV